MDRYPRPARQARIKCVRCNAPVVATLDGPYVCVSCGDARLSARRADEQPS